MKILFSSDTPTPIKNSMSCDRLQPMATAHCPLTASLSNGETKP